VKDDLEKIELMRFTTPDEFYESKKEIKAIYQELSKKGKEIYKWYFFYELSMLRNPLKELMWEYLNFEELNIQFKSNLIHEYELYCKKRNRLMKIDK